MSNNEKKGYRGDDIKYDILGGKDNADHILFRKDRPIKGLDITEEKLMHLEVLKAKIVNTRKYKNEDMLLNRSACKRMINEMGFYMDSDLPDGLNKIVIQLIEEAIARVYALPGRMERITVRPSDLPLIYR